jgi:hypothetical protein
MSLSLQFILDWIRIAAILMAACATILAGLIGVVWLCTKQLGKGPERIVDVDNRGHTRIRMPDGSIR